MLQEHHLVFLALITKKESVKQKNNKKTTTVLSVSPLSKCNLNGNCLPYLKENQHLIVNTNQCFIQSRILLRVLVFQALEKYSSVTE